MVVCGSLSSWIVKNIIENTGSLYHRVTYRLQVKPFNLEQTNRFLKENNGVQLTQKHILKLYMVLGGIPLYLGQIKKGKSSDQIIDDICFNGEGLLFDEMKEYAAQLENKLKVFQMQTQTRKQIFLAFVSANGVNPNKHSEKLLSNIVTLEDLFTE
ncbi:MAG: hypothetical protein JSR33_02640 [Proteobacteria bacterium]|nr:hypothetical protein [Pseudomonadota bacterium]